MTPSETLRKSRAINIALWNFIFQNGLSMVSVDDVSLKLWLPWTKYLPYSSSISVLFSFKKLWPIFGLANIDYLSSLAFLWGSLRKWEICRLNYLKWLLTIHSIVQEMPRWRSKKASRSRKKAGQSPGQYQRFYRGRSCKASKWSGLWNKIKTCLLKRSARRYPTIRMLGMLNICLFLENAPIDSTRIAAKLTKKSTEKVPSIQMSLVRFSGGGP